MYVCVHACMHESCQHPLVYVCMHICMIAEIHLCCMHVNILVCRHASMHKYVCICVNLYIVCMYECIYVYL